MQLNKEEGLANLLPSVCDGEQSSGREYVLGSQGVGWVGELRGKFSAHTITFALGLEEKTLPSPSWV